MAGVTAQGGTFTFDGVSATIVALSVDSAVAEVVDMTSSVHSVNHIHMVPTGAWSGGSISVDYLHGGSFDATSTIGQVKQLSFSCARYSVAKWAVHESSSTQLKVGDLVRGTMKFRLTDFQG
jgi:hypothetical protein